MSLRWEKQPFGNGEFAYSGELVVGMIGARDNGTYWYSTTSAVHMRRIAKTHGEVRRLSTARNAVNKAWDRWLSLAGLTDKAQ